MVAWIAVLLHHDFIVGGFLRGIRISALAVVNLHEETIIVDLINDFRRLLHDFGEHL
jgi:hypothetical protein